LERNEVNTTARRLDAVDTLRGFSILAVIFLHFDIRMRLGGTPIAQNAPPWLFHLLFRNGNNGVSVFFAISGFLITTTSLRRFGALKHLTLRAFYRIRFARIAPLLLIVLLALSILHCMKAQGFYIAPEKATLARALFSALTFH
jgi:peptidoglycan/LPS O-acetylase OafA/YrhL